jgi:hypothetical protein
MPSPRAHSKKSADHSVEEYLAECRARLGDFTQEQFSWEGALRMRRTALAPDLLIAPVNVLLALPAVIARKTITFFERSGFEGAAKFLQHIPVGVKTGYQREVERRVWAELFGLGDRVKTSREREDALERVITDPAKRERLHARMEKELNEFFNRRAYISDLISSATTWAVAWLLYRDSALGIWDIGRKLANGFARKKAASGFFLGEGIGNAFYSVVPVQASAGQVFVASVATLLFLTAFAVVVSYLSEPVQLGLGIQRRQLNLLLDSLEDRTA